MEKNATIRIKESKNGEPILFSTGKIVRLGNSWNVRYGQEGAIYTIGVSDGLVSIAREGEEDYAIVLREGKIFPFKISTPYGDLPMKVATDTVFLAERETGLSLDLVYRLIGENGQSQKFSLYLDCEYEN